MVGFSTCYPDISNMKSSLRPFQVRLCCAARANQKASRVKLCTGTVFNRGYIFHIRCDIKTALLTSPPSRHSNLTRYYEMTSLCDKDEIMPKPMSGLNKPVLHSHVVLRYIPLRALSTGLINIPLWPGSDWQVTFIH